LPSANSTITQCIKTDLYSAVCRKRIRGAKWLSSVKQFRLKHMGKSTEQFQDLQLNEREFQTALVVLVQDLVQELHLNASYS